MAPTPELNLEEFEALKAKLVSKEGQISQYFNENVHSVFSRSLIRRLKFEPRVAEKCFFPLIMAIPFDPFLGKETEEYSPISKFMSLVAPSKMMQLIQIECEKNSELKRAYMRRANFTGDWDTSDPANINSEAAQAILWIYRRPMTYSHPAVKINNEGITGSKFQNSYLLNTRQDPITGEFIGELSTMHKYANLVGSLCKVELDSFNDGISTKDPNTVSRIMGRSFALSPDYLAVIPDKDSLVAKERRGEIRKAYPLSFPMPLLTTVGMMFSVAPVTGLVLQQVGGSKYEVLPHFREDIDFKAHLFFTDKYAALESIGLVIGNYHPKNPRNFAERNAATDLYPDFCVMDFITDDVRDKMSPEEKMQAAQKTQLQTEKKPLFDVAREGGPGFINADIAGFMLRLSGFYDEADQNNLIEAIRNLLVQSYKPVTQAMEDSTYKYLTEKFPLSLEVLYTDTIKIQHADTLVELFPEEFAAEAVKLDEKLEQSGDLMKELIAKQALMGSGEIPEEFREEVDEADGGISEAENLALEGADTIE